MNLVGFVLLGLLFKLGDQLFLGLAIAKGVFRTTGRVMFFVAGGSVAFFRGAKRFVLFHDLALSARGYTSRSRCTAIAAICPLIQAGTA
ncbi:hypothetical protein SAMN04487859_11194 [Roseovarius lutimaris]|uniref:Uncharacterized protein n=1 Tax=Roseovarius lutimaris TaxID=1005928 RepID=A0A1I5D0C4_9RHOB|nr:hypothetical protein SAMN04487859_11194 [Roseovarius lutimaris]